MTGWLRTIRNSGSTAGYVLITLGTFLLYENLSGVLNSITAHGAVRILPAILVSIARFLETHGQADRSGLVRYMISQVLCSIWPAMLVIVGSILA